ncbi:cryptochrome/photolyase family protein [Taibaiella koreensis]|uniref:cryptochrome/photolyase family protein n=1 Tax=Taibaiella koreensis TaxID=1268548 RepID=UPI000E5A09B7|nr:deoxyribodipyrimidine photo-lyase [Taibaiella koreensis]
MKTAVFWFRRDLRLDDNAGLYHALKGDLSVLPIFIFDTAILDELEEKADKRVVFIHEQILALDRQLQKWGSAMQVFHGTPVEAFQELIKAHDIAAVYTNRDYEPYATQRDSTIAGLLKKEGISFHTFKDQVIFDRSEVVKDDGTSYTVFTPYSKKWLARLEDDHLKPYPIQKYKHNFFPSKKTVIPSLKQLGFVAGKEPFPSSTPDEALIRHYDKTRDIPTIEGTTRLGIHLRFGTISIRVLASHARQWNDTFLKELIWREFFMMILWHFPRVVNTAFREEYDRIVWRNKETEFERWCRGQTGYPIVDAGMRQLNATGFMHNRVRMVAASFLTKHLLIDWRWGEAYFAQKLLDYDLAANNGNWQWSAGCGCDAAPYFRIFNPQRQTEKFDPDGKYLAQWVPEWGSDAYPEPMVDHATARDRCLAAYKKALQR